VGAAIDIGLELIVDLLEAMLARAARRFKMFVNVYYCIMSPMTEARR